MRIDPPDFEIGAIGLDKVFESIIPGGDTEPNTTNTSTENESSETIIDDPLGW